MNAPLSTDPAHHANWLGLSQVLRKLTGRLPSLVGSQNDSLDGIKLTSVDAPVFICGHDSFGESQQGRDDIRYRLMRRFPERTIVQMSQTIHFSDDGLLEYAKRAIGRHRNFYCVAGDARSYRLVETEFDCPVAAGPDTAFGLGVLPPFEADPLRDLYVMQPWDRSRMDLTHARACVDGPITDWVNGATNIGRVRFSSLISTALNRGFTVRELAAQHQDDLARRYVNYGVKLLSGAERIITNRVHGHILSLLINKPHVAVGERGSQLFDHVENWSGGSPLVQTASDSTELLAALSRLPYEINGAWYKESQPLFSSIENSLPDLAMDPAQV